jgi:hypothetical protein
MHWFESHFRFSPVLLFLLLNTSQAIAQVTLLQCNINRSEDGQALNAASVVLTVEHIDGVLYFSTEGPQDFKFTVSDASYTNEDGSSTVAENNSGKLLYNIHTRTIKKKYITDIYFSLDRVTGLLSADFFTKSRKRRIATSEEFSGVCKRLSGKKEF